MAREVRPRSQLSLIDSSHCHRISSSESAIMFGILRRWFSSVRSGRRHHRRSNFSRLESNEKKRMLRSSKGAGSRSLTRSCDHPRLAVQSTRCKPRREPAEASEETLFDQKRGRPGKGEGGNIILLHTPTNSPRRTTYSLPYVVPITLLTAFPTS